MKHKRVLTKLKSYESGGRLLDIGCNTGSFIKAASDVGFTPYGLDISKEAVAYARNMLSLQVFCGDFIDYDFKENHFDVITIIHVLEHVKKPKETLLKIFNLLEKDGILFIAAPNFDSIQSRLFGSKWFHLDVPRHLYHFRPDSLKNTIEGVGFRIMDFDSGPEHFEFSGFEGSIIRITNFRRIKFLKGFLKRILDIIGFPLIKIERKLGIGASFEIVAKK